MDANSFVCLLSIVIDDMTILPKKYFTNNLPRSWTSSKLRQIELSAHIHHNRIPTTTIIRNGRRSGVVSVATLLDGLVGTVDKAVWRHYCPCIDTKTDKLKRFEDILLSAIITELNSVIIYCDEMQTNREIERFSVISNRIQTIFARGARSIRVNKFFSIIHRAARLNMIDKKVCDEIRYTSILLYSVKSALIEWMKMKNIKIEDVVDIDLENNDVTIIHKIADELLSERESKLKELNNKDLSGLDDLFNEGPALEVVYFRENKFLSRDKIKFLPASNADMLSETASVLFEFNDNSAKKVIRRINVALNNQ